MYSLHHRARVMLTEVWAKELKADGVVTNSVHPGWVDTPLLASAAPMQGFYKYVYRMVMMMMTTMTSRLHRENADRLIHSLFSLSHTYI